MILFLFLLSIVITFLLMRWLDPEAGGLVDLVKSESKPIRLKWSLGDESTETTAGVHITRTTEQVREMTDNRSIKLLYEDNRDIRVHYLPEMKIEKLRDTIYPPAASIRYKNGVLLTYSRTVNITDVKDLPAMVHIPHDKPVRIKMTPDQELHIEVNNLTIELQRSLQDITITRLIATWWPYDSLQLTVRELHLVKTNVRPPVNLNTLYSLTTEVDCQKLLGETRETLRELKIIGRSVNQFRKSKVVYDNIRSLSLPALTLNKTLNLIKTNFPSIEKLDLTLTSGHLLTSDIPQVKELKIRFVGGYLTVDKDIKSLWIDKVGSRQVIPVEITGKVKKLRINDLHYEL